MRLNLGCGKATFPAIKDDPLYDHLAYALPDSAYTATDWVNVDRVDLPSVDQRWNVMVYPWPVEDNSVNEIWASHIVEHIPHEPTWHPNAFLDPELRRMGELDGWYAWFYEAWRTLKPGGSLHIVCPYAFSISGVADPTHRRYIVPGSFSYLAPNPKAPYDYQIACEFAAKEDAEVKIWEGWLHELERLTASESELLLMGTVGAVYELHLEMTAVKHAG